MDAVVVTYNSAEAISRLRLISHLSDLFDRVIVVDNGSTDQTRKLAGANGTHIVCLPRNVGFGQAANFGVALVRTTCFALLNPDIVFGNVHDLMLLERHLDNSSVALCAPALVLPNGTLQDSARAVPSPLTLLERRILGRDSGAIRPTIAQDVPWVVGGCMIIRRSAFEAVRGFDPRYFLYFEDVDLCVRLRLAGWKVRFEPAAVVRHEHAAESRGSLHGLAARHHIRSAARFYMRYPRYLITSGSNA